MRKAFLIVTVDNRIDELNQLLRSIRIQPEKFEDWSLNLMFQGSREVMGRIEDLDRFSVVEYSSEMLGCHAARVLLLRNVEADVFCNLDDDMELVEETNYQPVVDRLNRDPRTGFILTNWARTKSMLEAKRPNRKDLFLKQILVYQGGGMLYRNDVADVIRKLPPVKQTFDTVWPLTAYCSGWTNYRYLGSLAIHKICGRGGMRSFMDQNPTQTMLEELVTFRKAKVVRGNGHDLLIPMDKDVTKKAHLLHKQNSFAKRFQL